MGQVGQISQINLSQGGVPKHSIAEAQITYVGLVGDRQNNLKYHGGADRAVCLWSLEVIEMLQQEGYPIAPGNVGENITVSGLDWATLTPGCRLKLGASVELQLTDYAAPCRQIMQWFADQRFNRISQKHHPGSSRLYARVVAEGKVAIGDTVVVSDNHSSGIRP